MEDQQSEQVRTKQLKREESIDTSANINDDAHDAKRVKISGSLELGSKNTLVIDSGVKEQIAGTSEISVPSAESSQENRKSGQKKGKGAIENENGDGDGKKKKKEWSSRRRGSRPEGEERSKDPSSSVIRLPKRQCALLIGFCGSGYAGMQIQPTVRTIEGVLFEALVASGAVSQDNADDPVKVGLNRAARTDAGVHAAGNVVSLKLIIVEPDIVQRINEKLPPEIRVWSFQRVQNSFAARTSCDSRKYTYFFPSYLLIPPKPGTAFYNSLKASWQKHHNADTTSAEPKPDSDSYTSASFEEDLFWKDVDLHGSREEDMDRKRAWRVGPRKVEALRKAAAKFLGTHNFHNFTVGRDFKEKSCHRHMKKIEVSDPVVYGETEWISVMLHGQSFMLHQRKMMCVLVMLVRTGTPDSLIEALYCQRTVAIPKMPSLGLLLECPIFESYNARVATLNKQGSLKPTDAEFRGPVDFDAHAEEMLRFKEEFIYKRMRESEDKVQVFDRWLAVFDRYSGNDLLYYNPLGSIPDEAVVVKGERRANAFKERKKFDATEYIVDSAAASAVLQEDDVDEEEVEEMSMKKRDLEEAEG